MASSSFGCPQDFFFLFFWPNILLFKLESSRPTTYTNIKLGSQTTPLQKNLSIICGKLTWNNIIPATIKVEANWVENLKSEKRKQNYDWKPKKKFFLEHQLVITLQILNQHTWVHAEIEKFYINVEQRGHLFSNISYLSKIMHLNGRRWKAIKQVNLVLAGRCNTTVSWTLSHLKQSWHEKPCIWAEIIKIQPRCY